MTLNDTTKTKAGRSNNNKNVMRKGSLFMCFRPVVLEPDGSGRGANDPVLTYIAVQRKSESVVFPKALPENDNETALSFDGNKEEDFQGKKVSGSRRFSHVLKAVLFEASMARKMKKGKSDRKCSNLLSESAGYNYHKSSNKDQLDLDFGQRIISRGLCALGTSSSASTATNSINNSLCPSCSSSLVTKTTPFVSLDNVKHKYGKRGYYNCNSGLFLMLVSLLVLVFWGKICAIFCTSTWLFFLPCVKDRDRVDTPDTLENLSECKRKIVMKGLLARERGNFRSQ